MSDLDATASVLHNHSSIDKVRQNINKESVDLTEEAIAQAAHEITQEIKAVTDEDEISTQNVRRSFKKWVLDQLDRVGQTAIALLAATIVALATPLLVKLELVDEWQKLSNDYSSVLTASVGNNEILQKTVTISQTAEQLESQNTTLIEALSALELQVADLKSTENITSNMEALKADLKTLIASQSLKLDGIESSLEEKQKSNNTPVYLPPKSKTNSPHFVQKLENYINKGNSLSQTQLDKNNEKLDSWIGEVYFFVSMMPSKDTDLNIVKSQLHKIYSAEKPFADSEYRLNQTIMVLNAVHSWAKIPG